MDIYATPQPDLEDDAVIRDIHAMRAAMSSQLRVPRRWTGTLRRTTQAKAIRGSNSIEGYDVSAQDAMAAVDDEPPLTADQRTWAEILGYRRALTYVLRMAADSDFVLDAQTIRSLHFMLLEHDVDKDPGRFRPGEVYVDADEERVYVGPDPDVVPTLVRTLVGRLHDERDLDPLIRGAMAHLNLVMIHPFRDGNGRMSRALQTLVLALNGIAEPEFSSIEEWLGANTDDYYRVLAATGGGTWHPERDAHLWVTFNLRAHHLQAQTVRGRFHRAARAYELLDDVVARQGLPDRVVNLLYTALLGYRLRRPTYVYQTGVDPRTASRDFKALADLRLLRPVGETRGRHYVRGEALDAVLQEIGRRPALHDPYPWLPARLRELTTE